MDRYRWNILGLFEIIWKNFCKTTTEEGYNVFLRGKEDRHKHGVGFRLHEGIVNTVMGCCPVSNKFIPSASVQTLVIDQTPKKGLLDVQETGMQKCARIVKKTGEAFADPSAMTKQMRGLRLLGFAIFNDPVLANTFGHHKAPRRWT